MIDSLITVLSSDLTLSALLGALVTYVIMLLKEQREHQHQMRILAEMVVLVVHLKACAQVIEEADIDPDRVNDLVEEEFEDERVLDAFMRTGRL